MYAKSLLRTDNLKSLSIKATTVTRYLAAASALVQMHSTHYKTPFFDPRKDTFGRRCADLSKVLTEHQRWENMPNRREPVTVAMLLHMGNSCPKDPNSLYQAHFDWNVLGHYFGFRKSEWCQDYDLLRKGIFLRTTHGALFATTLADITFLGVNDYELHDKEHALQHPNTIHGIRHRWRFQKNGNNGERRSLVRNQTCPLLCPVAATIRIVTRAITLSLKPTEPLAIYRPEGGSTYQFINNKHVQCLLQQTARTIYNIKDPSILALWSCHSIRVGACVTMFLGKQSPDRIQHALRWKSATWRDYLRDCTALSESQMHCVQKAVNNTVAQQKLEQECD